MSHVVARRDDQMWSRDGADRATRTRSDVLIDEITKQIHERRASIDAAQDLGEVTFCVKLIAGSAYIRALEYSEHRVYRRTAS